MKIYTLYFSPTGGTKKVLDLISTPWDCERVEIDLSETSDSLSDIVFQETDVCIVAVPSFSGRVPQFIIPRLQKLCGRGTKAVLVTAYGNRAFEDTLIELKTVLASAGFRCVCAVAAVTQHSIMPKFGKGRPDASDIAELKVFAKKCKIAVQTAETEVKVPGNVPYRAYHTIPMQPKAGRNCKKCGICAKKCPVQAIPLQNPRITDKEKCISCLQCTAVCPHHARHISSLKRWAAERKLKKVCFGRKENKFFGFEEKN